MKNGNSEKDPRIHRMERVLSHAVERNDGPKDQRYVTRAYQELFFTPDGEFSVYDRTRACFKTKGKKGVAFLDEFYVFIDDHGEKRFDVEHAIAAFENDAIPIIKRLCQREAIDDLDRTTLSWFIAINLLRTPQVLDEILGVYKAMALYLKEHFGDEATARKYFEDEQGKNPLRAAEMAAYIFGRAVLAPGRQAALGLFLGALPIVYKRIHWSYWQILESPAPNARFVISDCGLANIAEDAESVGHFFATGMQLAFPLSPKFCLVSHHSSGKEGVEYEMSGVDLVRQINEATAWASARYVMGSNRRQLEDVVTVFDRQPATWKPVFPVR
jgi:hypothetical protein